jgi:hypothetical protein
VNATNEVTLSDGHVVECAARGRKNLQARLPLVLASSIREPIVRHYHLLPLKRRTCAVDLITASQWLSGGTGTACGCAVDG